MKHFKLFFLLILFLFSWQNKNISSDWIHPINISNTKYHSTSPAIAIGPDGKIYVVWSERDQPDNSLKARIYLTINDGGNWTHPVAITDTGNADWTPDIVVDKKGNVHVVWGELFSGSIYYKSYQNGKWSPKINISKDSYASFYPAITVDQNNNVHVVWNCDNIKYQVSICYKKFNGSEWSATKIISDTLKICVKPKIKADLNNNLHVTWSANYTTNSNHNIFYRRCLQGEWQNIVRLSAENTLSAGFQDIALKQNKFPVVVWNQTVQWLDKPVIKRIFYREFNGSSWDSTKIVFLDSLISRSSRPTIAITRDNYACIAWMYAIDVPGTEHTDVYFSYGKNGLFVEPVNLSYGMPYNSGPSKIIVDSDDRIHIVWVYGAPSPKPNGEIYYSARPKITGFKKILTKNVDQDVLYPNYPNPFNQTTYIRYYLANRSFVSLSLYDLSGKVILNKVNRYQNPGTHKILIDAKNLPSGIYICKIEINNKPKLRIRKLYG